MQSTFLGVPAKDAIRKAKSYNLAIASAIVSGGAVSQINLEGKGGSYSTAPDVAIVGGGGVGAEATATVANGKVTAISVVQGGTGYVAPPSVMSSDVNQKKSANAIAIVNHGRVAAVLIVFGGSGYDEAPQVTISGGGGTGATATAQIANGRVVAVTVGHGGSGYADRLAVIVAPGGAESSGVAVWAPAGALKSTMDDLMRFAAAALPQSALLPWLPPSLTAGFQIAEQAYVCQDSDPDFSSCKHKRRSGLAWGITPADEAYGVPEVVVKDGGLPAFSSEIFLMPKRQLAVVALVNSRSPADDPIGRFTFRPAETLAANIGYALFFALPWKANP